MFVLPSTPRPGGEQALHRGRRVWRHVPLEDPRARGRRHPSMQKMSLIATGTPASAPPPAQPASSSSAPQVGTELVAAALRVRGGPLGGRSLARRDLAEASTTLSRASLTPAERERGRSRPRCRGRRRGPARGSGREPARRRGGRSRARRRARSARPRRDPARRSSRRARGSPESSPAIRSTSSSVRRSRASRAMWRTCSRSIIGAIVGARRRPPLAVGGRDAGRPPGRAAARPAPVGWRREPRCPERPIRAARRRRRPPTIAPRLAADAQHPPAAAISRGGAVRRRARDPPGRRCEVRPLLLHRRQPP